MKRFLRKLAGVVASLFSLSSAVFVAAAIGDLLGGDTTTKPGVLVGLLVFFTGTMLMSGYGALRMFRAASAADADAVGARTTSTTAAAAAAAGAETGGAIVDIELEARILALAARASGRVTAAEVAVGCSVPIDEAARALDSLAVRGHADLQVTPDGDTVYAVKGFLSAQEKAAADDVLAVVDKARSTQS